MALEFEGSTISYMLERSRKRRRTIAIHVGESGVTVRAPQASSVQAIRELVRGKAPWIIKKLTQAQARADLTARRFVDGEVFKFLGRDYPLVIKEAPLKRAVAARFSGGCLMIKIAPELNEEERADWARDALKKWYLPRAKSYITKATAARAASTGMTPNLVRVKSLASSWGVCTRENISFNWRLIMAPPELIDYVIVHELCHLKHKNHSPTYYAAVAAILPDYKERRKELRRLAPWLEL